jgi:CBS domain-containing protein
MADRPFRRQHLLCALSLGVLASLVSSCSEKSEASSSAVTSRPSSAKATPTAEGSRFVLGDPEPGLSFTVSEPGSTSSGPKLVVAEAPELRAVNAEAAAVEFGRAIVDGRIDVAYALLTANERDRLGSAARFRDALTRESPWRSILLDGEPNTGAASSPTGTSVALTVTQSAGIDDIRGVVAPTATVRFPVVNEDGSWRVRWERRQLTPHYAADESRLRRDVTTWVADRQRQCGPTSPASEYAGGLIGIVGLADGLCTTKGAAVVSGVGDFYSLDDPQPLLDAFGSASYDWARVVSLSAPAPMDVIAAPFGDRWLVVGVAPTRRPTA